jgi:hypothetical protein
MLINTSNNTHSPRFTSQKTAQAVSYRNGPSALSFSLTSPTSSTTFSTEELTSGKGYRQVAHDLTHKLLEEQLPLRGVVEDGLIPFIDEEALATFDPRGRFDHAVSELRLNRLGPSRFLLQTFFYLGEQLVATVSECGKLAFESPA